MEDSKISVLSLFHVNKHALHITFALSLIVVLSGCSCTKVNEPAPTTGGTVSFATDIQPIFTASCARYHQTGGFAHTGIPLINRPIPMLLTDGDSYSSIVNIPSEFDSSQLLVVPSDSDNSALFGKLTEFPPPVGRSRMPLGTGPLSPEYLGLVRDWIDQGAADN